LSGEVVAEEANTRMREVSSAPSIFWHESEQGHQLHQRAVRYSTHGPKIGVCAPFLRGGGWVPIYLTQCRLGRGLPPNQVAIDPSSRLATIDMGRTLGAVPLFGELGPHLTQSRLGRDLPLYEVAPSSIQPFGHNRHMPKWVLCPFGRRRGRGAPHLTQCGRGVPPWQVSS